MEKLPPVVKQIAVCTFLNRLGSGLLVLLIPVYFVRHIGFEPQQLGLTLGIATLLAMCVSLPTGSLVERIGVTPVYRWALLALALTSLTPAFADGIAAAAAAWFGLAVVDGAFRTANQALVGEVSVPGSAAKNKGILRAVTNIAMSLGMALGGFVLIVNSSSAFKAALVFNALMTAGAFIAAAPIPRIPTPDRSERPRLRDPVKDRPYVLTMLCLGVSSIHFSAIDVALALFIIAFTDLPNWIPAAFFIVNTVGVALFQARIAGRVDALVKAPRYLSLGAALIIVSFALVSACAWAPFPLQVASICIAVLVYTTGEMTASAAEWSLLFDSVPDSRHGAYQALATTSQSLFDAGYRAVVPIICLSFSGAGWLLAGLVAVVGAGLAVLASGKLASTRTRSLS